MQVTDALDAIRVKDGKAVWLKHVPRTSPEIEIGKLLSLPGQKCLQNHTCPLLDVLMSDEDKDHAILVFPVLRPIYKPIPVTIRECVDFVKQTLEVSLSESLLSDKT